MWPYPTGGFYSMMLFVSEGRLGNQIFQYAFLETIRKLNETLIVFGFDELIEVFDMPASFLNIKKNRTTNLLVFKIIRPILYFISKIRIISSISVDREKVFEHYTREGITYTKLKGIFNFITLVKTGYFQSESFFDPNVVKKLVIKKKYLELADEFLQTIPPDAYKVFVHIRLRDYKNFTVYGKTTLLPFSYYHKCIKWFMENKKNVYFIFLSDEPETIEREFIYLKNKTISKGNHFGTDFAIITKCDAGILSASSFSWWGSYLMKNRDLVIAPKYWLGFNARENYHSKPLASFMLEVKIYDTKSEVLE